MSERQFTHYKYPHSRTRSLSADPTVQNYYKNRKGPTQIGEEFPTSYMEVSIDAFQHNFDALSQLTNSEEVEIDPVAKYGFMGTGGPLIAKTLFEQGASKMCYANPEELLFTNKELGKNVQSLMLYPITGKGDLNIALKGGAELTVQSLPELQILQEVARELGVKAVVHLAAETGFHGYGGSLDVLSQIFEHVAENQDMLAIKAISSHFASAGDNNTLAQAQFAHFLELLGGLSARGHTASSVHISNSAAITQLPETWHRQTYMGVMPGASIAIRPGGLIYGLYGDPNNTLNLQSTVPAVVSHIAGTQYIEKGQSVGYCNKFTAPSPMDVATIPLGWGSGYMVNRTQVDAMDGDITAVLINGARAPILGLVGASSFGVENRGRGQVGDPVLLIGKERGEEVTFDTVAAENGMISTQLTTMLAKSLPQVYYKGL